MIAAKFIALRALTKKFRIVCSVFIANRICSYNNNIC